MTNQVLIVAIVAVAGLGAVYLLTKPKPDHHESFWDAVSHIGVSGNQYVGSNAAKILGAIGL